MLEVTSLCGQICLGKQGENLARIVYFNEPEQWKSTFGEGKCELLHQRNGDVAPYPVLLDIEENKIGWKITNADTAFVGDGKCELHYSVDGVIVKSKIWTTTVLPSLGEATEEPPEPQQAWVDQVLDAAERVEDATTHQPMIGENKNWFIWDAEKQEYVDSGVSSQGGGSGGGDYILTDADKAEIANIVMDSDTLNDSIEGKVQSEVNGSLTTMENYVRTAEGFVADASNFAVTATIQAGEAEKSAKYANECATAASEFEYDAMEYSYAAKAAADRAEEAANNCVVLKKKWSAIDTITLTEPVNAVDVTTPFAENKYTGVVVDIEVASGGTYASQKARIDIVPNSQKFGINYGFNILGNTPYTKVYYELQNGMWSGWWQSLSASASSTTHSMNNINTMMFVDGEDWVKKVSFSCDNPADKFPAGTRIRLWGVK